MEIKSLKPTALWNYFYEICQIPHPSKKEGKIIEYLLDFAKKHKLEAKKDEIGNVVIIKPASKGMENRPTVILQGHVDMVCEKNNDTKHDFDKDPIQTYIDGDYVRAKGTTLGADNGIGVAAALAILSDDKMVHPKLECLFTVDEETGLTGAFALKQDFLTGDVLLNLDTEEEGEIYIGCAGGKGTTVVFEYEKEKPEDNYFWFKVSVSGLSGGHSGAEIHKGLGNANKILNRYLYLLNNKYKLELAEIDGGNLHNAIAREAYAVAGVKTGKDGNSKEGIIVDLNTLLPQIQKELIKIDSKLTIKVESTDAPKFVIDKKTKNRLINAIYACPHGVLGMSHDIEGLVETSTNLASVKMKEGNTIVVTTSQRSSTESLKDDAANMIEALFTLAKAKVTMSAGYPGWKPNTDSVILNVAKKTYKDMYKKEAEIKAIHAGLECGLFLEKYPHLDMISCGPTITEAHSPDEKVNIPSVLKWWDFLVAVLGNVPAKK